MYVGPEVHKESASDLLKSTFDVEVCIYCRFVCYSGGLDESMDICVLLVGYGAVRCDVVCR